LAESKETTEELRSLAINFLNCSLNLQTNAKNDIIIKAKWGLYFLGSIIYSYGRKLTKRTKRRIIYKSNYKNIPSYYGIIKPFGQKEIKRFDWLIINILNYEL